MFWFYFYISSHNFYSVNSHLLLHLVVFSIYYVYYILFITVVYYSLTIYTI